MPLRGTVHRSAEEMPLRTMAREASMTIFLTPEFYTACGAKPSTCKLERETSTRASPCLAVGPVVRCAREPPPDFSFPYICTLQHDRAPEHLLSIFRLGARLAPRLNCTEGLTPKTPNIRREASECAGVRIFRQPVRDELHAAVRGSESSPRVSNSWS
ncbi:hypothetical protein D3C85_1213030 [compost metagenome]